MSLSGKSSIDDPIDIVIFWVDGSDPDWLREKNKALEISENTANASYRFRDWGLLRYWFRGIEKFAPWVNSIHFVTWGHLPIWLKKDHPKLHIVKHADFMPEKALPTFNSNALLINAHRIPSLANKFVLFNDDTFLIAKTNPEDFFKKGLPRLRAVHCPYRLEVEDPFFPPLNDIAIINNHFPMRKAIATHLGKWINPLNGFSILSTVLMFPFPAFYGFKNDHLPVPFLKKTFEEIWESEFDLLYNTTLHKARTPFDVNEWLMTYWQLTSGSFYPSRKKYGKAFFPARYDNSRDFSKAVSDYVFHQRGITICINDGKIFNEDFAIARDTINQSFSALLPNKSSFEY